MGEGQLAWHTASLISSLCQSNCSLGSSAPVTRSELISPKSTSPLLLFLSFLKYSIPCNKNHQTPPFAPSFFLCRTFPLQCLHNSSNSFQICSSRKRCMCEAFWYLYSRLLPLWGAHLEWMSTSQLCTQRNCRNFQEMKSGGRALPFNLLSQAFKSHSLALKGEWCPELWQPDPSFPHSVAVLRVISVGGDLTHLIQETPGCCRKGRCSKWDSVW